MAREIDAVNGNKQGREEETPKNPTKRRRKRMRRRRRSSLRERERKRKRGNREGKSKSARVEKILRRR